MTGSPDFQTLSQAVLHYSKVKPEATAFLSTTGRRITWAGLARLIAQMSIHLRDLGLGPHSIIGVSIQRQHVHLALLLAIENIGAGSVSLRPTQLRTGRPLYDLCNFILTSAPGEATPEQGRFRITDTWQRQVFETPVTDADIEGIGHAPAASGFVRYTSTSGTTGERKILGVTQTEQMLISAAQLTRPEGLVNDPRLLAIYDFDVEAMYKAATSCLLMGGAIIFARGTRIENMRHRPNVAWLIPSDANLMVRSLPEDFRKPDNLVLICSGAPVTENLRAALLERLASRVIERYASNETSLIGVRRDDGSFDILSGVDVAIVDPQGSPLPDGEAGAIRIRSRTVLSGYLNNPAETAVRFRDGWFLSNDMGVMTEPGRLQLLGRIDDMLNLNGSKVSPYVVEAQLRATPGIQDALCVAVDMSGMGATLCVAVVRSPESVAHQLTERIMSKVPVRRRTHIQYLEALPLTEIGKPDRRAVQALFEAAAAAARLDTTR
jgi:acyl-coenzyme A synthetase/AMP-(fatty) acid ligase